MSQRVYVLDDSSRRRAKLTWELTRSGLAVQPFETFDELLAMNGGIDGIFVHLSDSQIVSQVAAFRDGADEWFPVIAYGHEQDMSVVVDAIKGGATDYLEYPLTGAKVRTRLAKVAERSGEERTKHALRIGARKRLAPLSPREREVLVHVSRGDSSKIIARNLDISPRTVELHRANLLNKLEAHSTAEAVRIAMEGGDIILPIPD